MSILAAIPIVGGIIEKVVGVIDKVVPDKDLAAKITADVQMELLRQDWEKTAAEFKDRDSARTLAAADIAKGNALSGFLAATVRPVWGYAALVVVVYPYLAGALHWPAVTIDGATKDILQTVIMFFFGGRTIEKVLPLIVGKK